MPEIKKDTSISTLTMTPVWHGVVIALVISVIGSLAYALGVRFNPILERQSALFARSITMAGAFLGGMKAGRRSDHLGWLHGAFTGLVYIGVVAILGRASGTQNASTYLLLGRSIMTIVVAALGGVAGVNL